MTIQPDQLPLDLGDNLRLRFATSTDDEQLIDLAFRALDESDEDLPAVRAFMQDFVEGKFPLLRYDDFTVVENTHTGAIVSSMCLMSEIWRYGGVPFKMGRPEIVMTDEDYRRRGLIRTQFEVIHAMSAQRGELMQCITGIPSYYRQFEYELALDLGGGYRIYEPMFPPLGEETKEDFHLRAPDSDEDRVFICHLHEEHTYQQLFAIEVDEAIWANEFEGYTEGSDGKSEWLLIENKDGDRLGYVNHAHIMWAATLNVNFVVLKPGVGYLNLLPHLLHGLYEIANNKLKKDSFKHPAKKVTGLYFRLGRKHPLYEAVGQDLMVQGLPYAWYIRAPDIPGFLGHVQSALEGNLERSLAAGYSGELKLNFYRYGVHLSFDAGRITGITPWVLQDGNDGDAHLPDQSFLHLLCGRRTAVDLSRDIADCWMKREARVLLDCLFPSFQGQVWVVGGGA
jgi:hypothetical protein